jgi:hypothetical protein
VKFLFFSDLGRVKCRLTKSVRKEEVDGGTCANRTKHAKCFSTTEKKQQKRVGRAATTTLDVRRTKKTSISRVMMKIVAFYKYISSPFLR